MKLEPVKTKRDRKIMTLQSDLLALVVKLQSFHEEKATKQNF
jgi:hypothetical protein